MLVDGQIIQKVHLEAFVREGSRVGVGQTEATDGRRDFAHHCAIVRLVKPADSAQHCPAVRRRVHRVLVSVQEARIGV